MLSVCALLDGLCPLQCGATRESLRRSAMCPASAARSGGAVSEEFRQPRCRRWPWPWAYQCWSSGEDLETLPGDSLHTGFGDSSLRLLREALARAKLQNGRHCRPLHLALRGLCHSWRRQRRLWRSGRDAGCRSSSRPRNSPQLTRLIPSMASRRAPRRGRVSAWGRRGRKRECWPYLRKGCLLGEHLAHTCPA